MSTARISIMRRQFAQIRQSCSPPATRGRARPRPRAVHSSSQYGHGSSKWTTPCCLQHPAHLDRPRRRVAAVGIDQQRRLVADRAAHRRHQRLGAARPLVGVVAALGADADLEGAIAVRRRAAGASRSASSSGRDVAAHAGGVDREAAAAARRAARRRSCPRACRAGPTARCRARPARGRRTSRGTCARARARARPAPRVVSASAPSACGATCRWSTVAVMSAL